MAQGVDPRRAYTDRGLLTEEFAEHYAFTAARWLLEQATDELISPGALVVAWDPRDVEGRFAGAIMRGVLRSGAHMLAVGMLPTPAAAVYMAGVGAAGAIVLTASHNPADQNGIKMFLGPRALKPLPEEDEELSALLWNSPWEEVVDTPESGVCTDTSSEARGFYSDYVRELANGWLRPGDLAEWDIAVDPARGAWSGLAAEVVEGFAPKSFAEVNRLGEGPVNEGGGVVALEGRRAIRGDERESIGAHAGLKRLFEAGRTRADDLRGGKGFAICGVFDADGDRAYTLVYDPFEDTALVLGGDESLVLQARFLQAEEELPEDGIAVLTIESDAGAAAALSELGLRVGFAPVGDKWLLRLAERFEGAFTCGGEESGHTIVPGRLADAYGHSRLLPVGDGLKGFLNTCAAIRRLTSGMDPRESYTMLAEPFPRGFKKSLYAYHVERGRFSPGSETWETVSRTLHEAASAAFPGDVALRWAPLEDDPSVMYLALDLDGRAEGAIYIRNSGTERRTGVVLRGPKRWEAALLEAGGAALRPILLGMKDGEDPGALAERALLRALAEGEADPVKLEESLFRDAEAKFGVEVALGRIFKEALRGGLMGQTEGRMALTDLGRWFLDNGRER